MPRKSGESKGGAAYSVVVSADDEPDQWLRERRTLLTATDIPSVLGVPGARSALETWYQKKDALMARSESEAIKAARAAGHDFEDSNANMFAQKTGRIVQRAQQLLRSKAHPWLGCTLDYLQWGSSEHCFPLETKNAGAHAAEEMWPTSREPHLTWLVQLHVQTLVLDVRWGSLSAWLGAPYVHHRFGDFQSEPELTTIILEEGHRFWKSLKRKTPPKDEPSPARFEVLRRLAPSRFTGRIVSLPPAAVIVDKRLQHLAGELEQARGALRVVEKLVEDERARMAELIGENAGGKLHGGTTWMFRHVHVPTHTVPAYSYRKLERVHVTDTKAKRTTWKTSK